MLVIPVTSRASRRPRDFSKAELVTCVALAAFALVFGLPGISGLPMRDVVAQLPWNIILIHGGSRWLSAALRDSGLAVWLVSSYTNERFRDMTAAWQLSVLLAASSLVNEGGEQPDMLTAQLVPVVTDMGIEIQHDPLFFIVPVAATCYLPVITPIAHLGLVFVYEHTTATLGEMSNWSIFLAKVVELTAASVKEAKASAAESAKPQGQTAGAARGPETSSRHVNKGQTIDVQKKDTATKTAPDTSESAGSEPMDVTKAGGSIGKRTREESTNDGTKTDAMNSEEPPQKSAGMRRLSIRPTPNIPPDKRTAETAPK
ncbi:hypothetical protein HPB52_006142 [Rhipicephalus sanguineus]|uniref:Uncharacterized protein n=1 Tax=Rhipicephalus sanguineus TaxID=34632 RepID=A0A9D4PV06_RHISA|nr:hypothetical protein HPB52_006142 [Rhipicephalus sanguineus]